MVAYASRKEGTPNYMPAAFYYATEMCKTLYLLGFKMGEIPNIKPDIKTQITMEYDENEIPVRIHTILTSCSHDPIEGADYERFEQQVKDMAISALPAQLIDENTNILINPTGRFAYHGPGADSGVVGRKLVCDSFGGYAPIGGGAQSGKDCTKVDRSALYAARWVAKNLVAEGRCDECTVTIAYAIGYCDPLSVTVKVPNNKELSAELSKWVAENVNLRPGAINKRFMLRYFPMTEATFFGQVGDPTYPWEKVGWQ